MRWQGCGAHGDEPPDQTHDPKPENENTKGFMQAIKLKFKRTHGQRHHPEPHGKKAQYNKCHAPVK